MTGELAKERLDTTGRSRSLVDWQGIRSLADDLETQRRAIVETVAKADPTEALDLLWRFMALASSVFKRVPGDARGAHSHSAAEPVDIYVPKFRKPG